MDDITFTYVVDGTMWMVPDVFLRAIPDWYWVDHPEEIGENGRIAMSTGGLLVERQGVRVLIDAGLGAVSYEGADGTADCGALPNTLSELGFAGEDIDILALTHMHVDHTGWAFLEDGKGVRRPAFPRARYVVAASEWEPYARGEHPAGAPGQRAVIEPLARHPGLELIDDGDEISPGIKALVSAGHSAGHTSYSIESASGKRLIAFGDAFHVPAQLTHPEWGSAPDSNPGSVPVARARLLDQLCRPDTYAFAIHFGDQPFGAVVRNDAGDAQWQPIATHIAAPAPR
jgi:glyoxylase-like metal-dependent hydrolase (beta-lactamase superfamily II)